MAEAETESQAQAPAIEASEFSSLLQQEWGSPRYVGA